MQAESPLADRYELVRRLASGGMGEVWLARDGVLGREVAVKLITVGTEGDPQAVERFRREATMTAALEHPNIVTIFDSGTHHGSAFIVMELLAGPTLAQFLADRGPLPELEVVRLGAQIAAGLAAAHRAGVVHRDIKPSNLMFSSSAMLKILDFGIARLSQTTSPSLTATNAVIGSAPYLSPEQALGAAADERSDLYSLGCVLVTMVTGLPPFTGEHPMAVLHQHVHNAPPLLRDRVPGVSSALEALVGQLLTKSAGGRPASADQVEQQLTRVMTARGETVAAATATLLVTGPAATAILPTTVSSATTLFPATGPAATAILPAAGASETEPVAPASTRLYPTAPWPPDIADARSREVRHNGSAKARTRLWWLLAASLVAVVVLVGAVVTPLLSRSGEGASQPSTSGTRSTPITSTAPATPASPKTTSQVPATTHPESPLANVRAVVASLVADGQMDARSADEFGHRLDDLTRKKPNNGKKAGKQIDDLSKFLTRLVKSGELTPDGFRRIEAALAEV